jgi:hypothetical protein
LLSPCRLGGSAFDSFFLAILSPVYEH